MTDQTQTMTELVAWTDVANLEKLKAKRGSATMWPHPHTGGSIPLYTTPQPLAIGLDRQRAIAAMSIELEKHPAFPDAVKALVWCSRLYDAALSPPAEGVKMLVDDDWLQRRIATDPDGDCEAGTPTPAPVDWERVGPKLVEALEPFAAAADFWEPLFPDAEPMMKPAAFVDRWKKLHGRKAAIPQFTVGDLKSARAALAAAQPEGK